MYEYKEFFLRLSLCYFFDMENNIVRVTIYIEIFGYMQYSRIF